MIQGTAKEKILIIDFGSQYTQLIARRVRENGVYSEIHPFNIIDYEFIKSFSPKGIILSGGPASVLGNHTPTVPKQIFDLNIPILGICYGQMVMADELGGEIEQSIHREFGRAYVEILDDCKLFDGSWVKGDKAQVWMSHGDRILKPPHGFSTVAKSNNAPFAVIADESKDFYGLMFHPEVVHTNQGGNLLYNFTRKISKCSGTWSMAAFREIEIDRIRKFVGHHNVICGLSGGVDSSVTALLLHEAIGKQLTCVFVDTGLMRFGEADEVLKLFRDHYKIRLIHKNVSELFLKKLKGISDPEKKRKIIGTTFIDVFENEARKTKNIKFLAQGTLYPDVIESVSSTGGPSVTIKSHHNVGGLPERMSLKLVEPLRELFKDEVRVLGEELNLPKQMINRHPFPGPGLAIRIPGEITHEKLDILRKADHIFLDEIKCHKLYDEIWQAFAILLPVQTVGVMGDGRTYEYVCALRAVTSIDGMTADYFHFNHEFLSHTSTRIINEVQGINRVVYDCTSKPPGTIEWE